MGHIYNSIKKNMANGQISSPSSQGLRKDDAKVAAEACLASMRENGKAFSDRFAVFYGNASTFAPGGYMRTLHSAAGEKLAGDVWAKLQDVNGQQLKDDLDNGGDGLDYADFVYGVANVPDGMQLQGSDFRNIRIGPSESIKFRVGDSALYEVFGGLEVNVEDQDGHIEPLCVPIGNGDIKPFHAYVDMKHAKFMEIAEQIGLAAPTGNTADFYGHEAREYKFDRDILMILDPEMASAYEERVHNPAYLEKVKSLEKVRELLGVAAEEAVGFGSDSMHPVYVSFDCTGGHKAEACVPGRDYLQAMLFAAEQLGDDGLLDSISSFEAVGDKPALRSGTGPFLINNGYGDEHVTVNVSQYHGGGLGIQLVCAGGEDDGMPFGTLTKNIGIPTKPYEAFIDTNNMQGAEKMLAQSGLAKPTGLSGRSGYCEYPLYRFSHEALAAADKQGTLAYAEGVQKEAQKKAAALDRGKEKLDAKENIFDSAGDDISLPR